MQLFSIIAFHHIFEFIEQFTFEKQTNAKSTGENHKHPSIDWKMSVKKSGPTNLPGERIFYCSFLDRILLFSHQGSAGSASRPQRRKWKKNTFHELNGLPQNGVSSDCPVNPNLIFNPQVWVVLPSIQQEKL